MKKIGFLNWVLLLFVVSCGPVYPIPTSILATNVPTITPRSTETPMAECGWYADIQAWIDQNANGTWDSGEKPLQDVVFFEYRGYESQFEKGQYAISDASGKGKLEIILWGCPQVVIQVFADPPADYIATTPNRIANPTPGSTLQFGFRYTDVVNPILFPTASLTCKSYYLPLTKRDGAGITEIAISSNGIAWVKQDDGLYGDDIVRIDPNDPYPSSFVKKDGLTSNNIWSVKIAQDGTVWVATDKGIARFNGSSWVEYAPSNKGIYYIALDHAGVVWMVNSNSIIRFDPTTNIWDMNTLPSGWPKLGDQIYSVENSPNDSLWFLSRFSVNEIIMPKAPNTSQNNLLVSQKPIPSFNDMIAKIEYNKKIAVSEDLIGLIGVGNAGSSAALYNLKRQEWTILNRRVTNGVMPGGIISVLAFTNDKSLWLGTSQNGAIHFIPKSTDGKTGTWFHYTTRNGLESNSITSINVAPDGYIWLGSKDGKVMRCKENVP